MNFFAKFLEDEEDAVEADVYSETCCFCCGAMEIGGFGGGEEFSGKEDQPSTEAITEAVSGILRTAKRSGKSLVYATTMSNQPHAAEALTDLGFYTTKPFRKNSSHDKRKMQAWFLPLVEFKG